MKLSELIARLAEMLEEHGDLETNASYVALSLDKAEPTVQIR